LGERLDDAESAELNSVPKVGGLVMQPNVGRTDRIVRIVVGIVIILLGLVYQSWWGVIGLIPVATGLLRWCPAYLPFGFSSDEKRG